MKKTISSKNRQKGGRVGSSVVDLFNADDVVGQSAARQCQQIMGLDRYLLMNEENSVFSKECFKNCIFSKVYFF